jgi:hypothetical protein
MQHKPVSFWEASAAAASRELRQPINPAAEHRPNYDEWREIRQWPKSPYERW